MKRLIAVAMMAASFGVGPTVVLAQAGDVCGPDGPAEYKRADGYCDRRNNSIYDLHDGDDCIVLQPMGLTLQKEDRYDVAQYCCDFMNRVDINLNELAVGDRVHVAQIDLCDFRGGEN